MPHEQQTQTQSSAWLGRAIRVRRGDEVAVHQQIADQLKGLIVAGRLEPGEPLPTHKELAAALGVHPLTISRSYTQLQSESLVLQQRGRGTIVGRIQQPQSDIVVLLPKWQEYSRSLDVAYAHQQFLAGMEHACAQCNAHLRILTVPTGLDEAGIGQWCARLRKDHHAVVTLMQEHIPLLAKLAESGFPALLYYAHTDHPAVSNLRYGWYESLKMATAHLIAQGRRRISYLGPNIAHPVPHHDGFDGYMAALEEAELPYYPSLSIRFPQHERAAEVERAVEVAVQTRRVGDAIVCHANMIHEAGATCVRVLQRYGRRIPDDVAVVGYEEHIGAMLSEPPLTWVPIPRYEMGIEVIRMAHQLMRDPSAAPLQSTFVPRLVPGGSCGGFRDGTGELQQVYSEAHPDDATEMQAVGKEG